MGGVPAGRIDTVRAEDAGCPTPLVSSGTGFARPSPLTSLPLAARTVLTLAVMTSTIAAQERDGNSVHYQLTRARVSFPAGSFSAEEMERFAGLADRGIADIDAEDLAGALGGDAGGDHHGFGHDLAQIIITDRFHRPR